MNTLDRLGSMGSSSSYSSSAKLRGELAPLHLSAITSCALPAAVTDKLVTLPSKQQGVMGMHLEGA